MFQSGYKEVRREDTGLDQKRIHKKKTIGRIHAKNTAIHSEIA